MIVGSKRIHSSINFFIISSLIRSINIKGRNVCGRVFLFAFPVSRKCWKLIPLPRANGRMTSSDAIIGNTRQATNLMKFVCLQ